MTERNFNLVSGKEAPGTRVNSNAKAHVFGRCCHKLRPILLPYLLAESIKSPTIPHLGVLVRLFIP